MVLVVALAGCDARGRPLPNEPREPRVIDARTMPWPDVSVRFVGLRDLSVPNGPDVELSWEIRHARRADGPPVMVVPIAGEVQLAERLELRLERTSTLTRVHIRLALDEAGSASRVTTTVGLRLMLTRDRRLESWEVAPRLVSLERPWDDAPLARRQYAADGRVELELVEAPDVPMRGEAWVMGHGTHHRVLYRAHNRSDGPLRVRLEGASFRTIDVDRTVELEPGEHVDVRLDTTPDEVGECGFTGPGCHFLGAQIVGEDWYSDALRRSIVVEPTTVDQRGR